MPWSVVLNALGVLGIPTGVTQNTRDLGMATPIIRLFFTSPVKKDKISSVIFLQNLRLKVSSS